jgi:hypothetical protein
VFCCYFLDYWARRIKDAEVLGAACRHWPLALRFANDDAKADRAVVLEACKDCTFGSALQYAAEELRDDRAFVRRVVNKELY